MTVLFSPEKFGLASDLTLISLHSQSSTR